MRACSRVFVRLRGPLCTALSLPSPVSVLHSLSISPALHACLPFHLCQSSSVGASFRYAADPRTIILAVLPANAGGSSISSLCS